MQHRKRRSFTGELLVWILLLVVMPVMAFQIYFYYHSFGQITEMEAEKARTSNLTAQKAIANLGDAILGITVTNAYWEENRQALAALDYEWLRENVADMPEIVPNIDFVAEADLQGNVLVQAGDVAELTGRIGYPAILEKFKQEQTFYGIVQTSRGLAILAVSEVTDEEGVEPPIGMLIAGQLLTPDILQGVSDILLADIAIKSSTGQYLASQNGAAEEELEGGAQISAANTNPFKLERKDGVYLAKYAAPLMDMAGEPIGIIHTQSPSVSSTEAADEQRNLMIYVIAILAILVALVVFLLRRRIVLPLRHFRLALQEVAAGKNVDSIPKNVLQAEAEIVQAIQQIMQWNQMLEATVKRRTEAIRNLLDHARQGFLSFGSDFFVKDEYSVECARLLGAEPAGQSLPDLLYPDDPEENALIRSILSDYFREPDPLTKELFFSLLPEEVRVGSRPVKIEFVPLPGGEETVMAMLTDLTETRNLENRMLQERQSLRMVVKAVTHPEDFARIKRDFETFVQTEIGECLASDGTPADKAGTLYRAIHTFKGSFAFLHFQNAVSKLHALESGLQERMKNDGLELSELKAYLQSQPLIAWLEEDLSLLRSVLGSSYDSLLTDDGIRLERGLWLEIEEKLRRHLPESEGGWLEKFHTWRYRPVSGLLKPYSAYLAELAERTGVLLHPVELRGGDIRVDPDRLYGFARSFVHVIRNVVTHGIEQPDERLAQGKDEHGQVSFEVEAYSGGIRIAFGDDGRGIDPDQLRKKARERGIDAEHLTDEEAVRLVFEERLSTAGQVSEWSGRGVGLSAVKDEVEQLGGSIEIRTRKGFGTLFIFELPMEHPRGVDRIGA